MRRNANNAPQEAPPENLNKFLHISCCPLLLLLLCLCIVVAVAAVHIAVAFAVCGALHLQLDTVFHHAHLFAMSTRVQQNKNRRAAEGLVLRRVRRADALCK